MAGPIVVSPPVRFDRAVLASPREGAPEYAAVNKALGKMLSDQARELELRAAPELARLDRNWQWLLPQLVRAAGVDQNDYEAAAKTYVAELKKIAEVAKRDPKQAVVEADRTLPEVLRKVAATAKPARIPTPGSSLALMGGEQLVGELDGGAVWSALLSLLEHPRCVEQDFTAPFAIEGITNIDTESDDLFNLDVFEPSSGDVQLSVTAGEGWPHKSVGLGAVFRVRDTDTRVGVGALLTSPGRVRFPTQADVAGFPYAHIWAQLGLAVSDGTNQVASSPVAEPFNIWTELGESQHPYDPAEVSSYSLACGFDRHPGDPTGYVATVQASLDATVFGIANASGVLSVRLERITVSGCS